MWFPVVTQILQCDQKEDFVEAYRTPWHGKGKNLYLVHCGFYDEEIGSGIYESHTNFFVVAGDFAEARTKVKTLPQFKQKRMHVDGLQEVRAVNGFAVNLLKIEELQNQTQIVTEKHRDLAPSVKAP